METISLNKSILLYLPGTRETEKKRQKARNKERDRERRRKTDKYRGRQSKRRKSFILTIPARPRRLVGLGPAEGADTDSSWKPTTRLESGCRLETGRGSE